MVADSFTKSLFIIKYEYFVGIIRIEEQKRFLFSIKKENHFKNAF